jgi:hypothetical protein
VDRVAAVLVSQGHAFINGHIVATMHTRSRLGKYHCVVGRCERCGTYYEADTTNWTPPAGMAEIELRTFSDPCAGELPSSQKAPRS